MEDRIGERRTEVRKERRGAWKRRSGVGREFILNKGISTNENMEE